MSQLQFFARSLSGGSIDTVTGNSGGPVTGDGSGNINIVGTGNITVAGNPGTFTETISITGVIPIANGGTNASSFATTDGVIYYDGTRLVATSAGTSGQVLTSNGAGVAPTYQSAVGNLSTLTGNTGGAVGPTAFNITTIGGNNITVAGNAGTSTLTYNVSGTTNHAVQVGNASGSLTSVAIGATGQGLMGSTGADPAWTGSPSFSGTITAGTGFVATTGNVTITAGNLALSNTNGAGTQGEITFGGSRWVSNFGTNNTFVGQGSGNTTLTPANASGNIGVGAATLVGLVDGADNVAVGRSALNAVTTGIANNAIGATALTLLTTGSFNVANGLAALSALVSGNRNIALGQQAGINYVAGESSNIVISNDGVASESNVIRIGTYGVGSSQQNKCYIAAAYSNFGTQNTFVGEVAANTTLTGTQNTCVGFNSLGLLTTGSTNSALGYFSLNDCTTGSSNTGLGSSSLTALTTGTANVGVGTATLLSLVSGGANIAVGNTSLNGITTGSYNIAVGHQSGILYSTSDSSNISLGNNGASGESNVIRIGTYGTGNSQQNKCYIASAYSNYGTNNTFVGEVAGNATLTVVSATDNTSLGFDTLNSLTTGAHNIAIGSSAGTAYSTESNNILLGNGGSAADANTIRIGTQGSGSGQQNKAFIAGITGVSVSNLQMVTIDTTTGQLGSQAVTPGTNAWTVVTASSATMATNNGYIANNAGMCTLTLPATAVVGSIIEVTGINNATGWRIAQNSGQVIHFGTKDTTMGAGGSLTSTAIRDSVRLVCVIADTDFNVLSSVGNITVV
jgi:trimeric autotransporter adhesin